MRELVGCVTFASILIGGPALSASAETADPLRHVTTAQGEIATNKQYSVPDRCRDSQFETFELPRRVSEEEASGLYELAAAAVRATGYPACECRVLYVDTPWDGVKAFRIEHGSCWTLTLQIVAVDAQGTAAIVGDDAEGVSESALASFNALAVRAGIVVDNRYYAESYLKDFLRLFFPHTGAYLPTRGVADQIARLKPFGEESELFHDALSQVTSPVIEMVVSEVPPFRADAYTWEWWYGGIEHIELSVSRDGTVAVSKQRYAVADNHGGTGDPVTP